MNGIKIAALRSGLTPHVIRMWEKRYLAVEPDRTPTNRRVYSDHSIQRLVHLADLTRNGHSIGNIANLPDKELLDLHADTGGLNICREIHARIAWSCRNVD